MHASEELDWDEVQELGTIGQRSLIDPGVLRAEYRRLTDAGPLTDSAGAESQPTIGRFMGGPWRWFGTRADLLSLFREVFLYQHYAPLVPLGSANGERGIILDVGAHVGTFSLWAHLALPARRLVCIEADPVTFAALNENVRHRLDPRGVELVNAAVLDREGRGILGGGVSDISVTTSPLADNRCETTVSFIQSTSSSRRNADSRASVPVNRLETFFRGNVDILKLDIEGAELQVLADLSNGGRLQAMRQIVVEVGQASVASNQDEPEDADRRVMTAAMLLQDGGYVVDIFPTSRRPLAEKDPRTENFILRAAQRSLFNARSD